LLEGKKDSPGGSNSKVVQSFGKTPFEWRRSWGSAEGGFCFCVLRVKTLNAPLPPRFFVEQVHNPQRKSKGSVTQDRGRTIGCLRKSF